MNFFVTLYIWTVVAATDAHMHSPQTFRDWRPAGEFRDVASCERGAKELGLKAGTYRCVRKDGA